MRAILGKTLMGVPVGDVRADEIWSFVGKKEKRRVAGDDPTLGDCYTFIAMETHSKLVLNVAIGRRDQGTTDVFIEGLPTATAGRFQLTPMVSLRSGDHGPRAGSGGAASMIRLTAEMKRTKNVRHEIDMADGYGCLFYAVVAGVLAVSGFVALRGLYSLIRGLGGS